MGPDMTFRTTSSPDINGVRSTEVEPTSAIVHASINPVGYAAKYFFEYGQTPSYGSKMPVAPVSIGSGKDDVLVQQQLTGLQPGVTYHYRVVAENEWGSSSSLDTTFDYAPPPCPNDELRQLTLGSYLPDCRAYELVSPPEAGSVVLFPSEIPLNYHNDQNHRDYGEGQDGEGVSYAVNQGFARAPSRFAFYAALGSVKGLNAPNEWHDMYVATRTNSGWVTTLPGLKGEEAAANSRKECGDTLEFCIDHQHEELFGFEAEFAPYLYETDSEKFLGRLPTNVDVIPNGLNWRGAQRMSGDFEHFVFSSNDYRESNTDFHSIAFAPGGVTEPFGSAYDNNLADRSVTIGLENAKRRKYAGSDPEGDHRKILRLPRPLPGRLPHPHLHPGWGGGDEPANLYMRVSQHHLRRLQGRSGRVRRHDPKRLEGRLLDRRPAHLRRHRQSSDLYIGARAVPNPTRP